MSIVLHGLLTDTSVRHMCSCPPHLLNIKVCKYYCCIDSMIWHVHYLGMVFSQIQPPNMCARAYYIISTSKDVRITVPLIRRIWNGNCFAMVF